MLAICEPMKAVDRRPSWEKCRKPQHVEIVTSQGSHPWELLMAQQFRQELLAAKFIAIYQKLSMPNVDGFIKTRNRLTHAGFHLKHYNRQVYKLAVEGTKFSSLAPILDVQDTVVALTSGGEEKVKELMTQVDKKMPGFILLFGILGNRVLRKDEMAEIAALPSLEYARAQLSATLNHIPSTILANLSYHPQLLSMSLGQYLKQQQEQSEKAEVVDEANETTISESRET